MRRPTSRRTRRCPKSWRSRKNKPRSAGDAQTGAAFPQKTWKSRPEAYKNRKICPDSLYPGNQIAKKKKISFYRISKNGGIAQTTLSEIVNGNNLNPTIETIQKIAKGLDVSVSELISKAETKTKEK